MSPSLFPANMASQSTAPPTRIKRKPPPAFPYSHRYPPPDPTDPFAPLSVLRSRAHSSTTALDTPSDPHASLRPSTADSRKTHYLYADAQAPDAPFSSPRAADAEPQRPWYGLAKGYLADAAKPLRPPKSKKRISQGRDLLAYFSEPDAQPDTLRQRLTIVHQTPVAQPRAQAAVAPEATPREKRGTVHRAESQYQQRRRSQSVNALTHGTRASGVQPMEPARANASESAQYAYDVRQSHGYVFGEVDHLDFIEYDNRSRMDKRVPKVMHMRSRSSTRSDTSVSEVSRHPTPPMTPDDTVSSISMTSPHGRRASSLSPPMLLEELPAQTDPKPLPIPIHTDDDDFVTPSNRNTIIVDTPVTGGQTIHSTEFSILLPPPVLPARPPSAPPSPVSEEPIGPLVTSVSRLPGRHVDSDTEAVVADSLRRRGRTTSLSEMRRRLARPTVATAGLRGKIISHPSPVVSPTAKQPLAAHIVPPVPTLKRTTDAPAVANILVSSPSVEEAPAVSPPAETQITLLAAPKPKKSLSHVNLGLKPLPNMSLAPTVAPSTNTSIASVAGFSALALTRPPEQPPAARAQTAPAPPPAEPRPQTQRAHTDAPCVVRQPAISRRHIAPPPAVEYDSEEEDLATYSILTTFTRALSPDVTPLLPSPVIADAPRASSPIPIPARRESARASALPPPTRRGSDQHTSSPPRTESPTPRVAVPAPKPAARAPEVPACYRKPEPLPLSPPPRAKSPIAAQFQHQPQQQQHLAASDPLESTPPRARSPAPVPAPARAKGASEARHVQKREDDERASERSSQRSSQRGRDAEDTGYLPVAQLRPAMSRQATAQSQAPGRRPTTSRGLSAASTKAQVGRAPASEDESPAPSPDVHPASSVREREREKGRAKTPDPLSARAVAAARVKPPPKDLDSPLPPPPLEFLAPPARVRSPPPPPPPPPPSTARPTSPAAARPEISSPMQLASPPPQTRRPHTSPLPTPSPATALQSPSPAPTGHSHPDDAVHGRACSPALSGSARGGGAYPPRAFDADALPTREQLVRAAGCVVVAQNGVRVPFGDVFGERKTVVVFIRHFWCPLCQDYMRSIARSVDPDALRRANVELVVIGNGSPAMIRSYKQIFRMPFTIYTDPEHRVYNALGMTLRTTDGGPEHERGAYVRHGIISGIAMVVRNALRVGMPVWEKGGDTAQLGGEFVLGPGMTCSYAHRMKNTRAHAPILDVVAAAGVQPYASAYRDDASSTWIQRRKSDRTARDCATPEWCGADDDASAQRSATSTSWESDARRRRAREAAEDADTEEERARVRRQRVHRARAQNLKKAPRSYRVANPDRVRPPAGRTGSTDKYEMWRPAGAPQLTEPAYGRDHEEAYMLTQEVLAYSFGGHTKNIN